MTSANDNYVNELSIWSAYCIFCLAWFFSKMLAVPHAHQANETGYPQNKILVQKIQPMIIKSNIF
ncbi:hypothetical protein ACQKOJ_26735, partial [Bacillus paramycoides]